MKSVVVFLGEDMARFVHLAPEKHVRGILRAGIRAQSTRIQDPADGRDVRGIYAMPVTPNFVVTHQWLRELKRGFTRAISGVYFHIPDDQVVWVGRYNGEHRRITAAEAVAELMAADRFDGAEVVISRGILRREITGVRNLPQVLGWRYRPDAKGHVPCGCPACQPRGEAKSRRFRIAYEADLAADLAAYLADT